MKIYAMSDIHGCLDELKKNMEYVDLSGDNMIIFLGDYIDYGYKSAQVLEYIYDLQKEHGDKKVVVLKGNHEAMLLSWIMEYNVIPEPGLEDLYFDSFLKTDSEYGYKTFRTFISDELMADFIEKEKKRSFFEINHEAVKLLLKEKRELISWIRKMKIYYETDTQIFIHAGIDEESIPDESVLDAWKYTDEDYLLGKFPATTGKFFKTIIAGHVGTASLAGDRSFHDVYFDGESHYYIDGSVYKGGKLPLLMCDTDDEKYYEIKNGKAYQVKNERL